ncbi:MAG: phosphotransferase family protein [Acidimicrobiales bacterium]
MPGSPRLPWRDLPDTVRRTIEDHVGVVTEAVNATSGFSPGLAARCRLASGETVFIKSVSTDQNPISPGMHRHEARVAAQFPAGLPAPRLRQVFDDGHYVTLIYDCIDGHNPTIPWAADELTATLAALEDISRWTVPSPVAGLVPMTELLADEFDGWSRLAEVDASDIDPWFHDHLDELVGWERAFFEIDHGDALVHLDVRSDNLVIDTTGQIWLVDWANAALGDPWVDLAAMLPSVTMEGGPPAAALWARSRFDATTNTDDLTAFVVAMAGMFTQRSRTPPPPGIPTLRTFQEAQAGPARDWVRHLLDP